MIKEVMCDIMRKRFAYNERIVQKTEFLLIYDPLITMNIEQKSHLAVAGYDKLVKNSIYAPQILDEMLVENPNLFEQGYQRVKQELDKRLDEINITPARQQLYG